MSARSPALIVTDTRFRQTITSAGIVLPAAPFLMGFILGPLLEDNLRRSYLISGDFTVFFRLPICWVFIVITALSLFVGIRRDQRQDPARPMLTLLSLLSRRLWIRFPYGLRRRVGPFKLP